MVRVDTKPSTVLLVIFSWPRAERVEPTPAAAKPNWMRLFFVLQSVVAGLASRTVHGTSRLHFQTPYRASNASEIIDRIQFDAR